MSMKPVACKGFVSRKQMRAVMAKHPRMAKKMLAATALEDLPETAAEGKAVANLRAKLAEIKERKGA